jgi:hypothetical protein
MFATAPASATLPATARERLIYDSPVLFVSAPSVLRFAVGPGEHTIRGSFGVESPRPQPPPDPVRFEALAGDTALLWSRTLDAARVAEDRGAQPFELTFSVDEPSELWLRTEAARSGDVRVDYAYWGEISVDGNARAHGGGAPPLQHDH